MGPTTFPLTASLHWILPLSSTDNTCAIYTKSKVYTRTTLDILLALLRVYMIENSLVPSGG